MRGVMTAIPGKITTFNAENQRAQVQFGIRPIVNGQPVKPLVVDNVPVQFGGDNNWYFYHQITPGETEGMCFFSQRNIQTWLEQGGPATPPDLRTFSAGDAVFVPGFRSNDTIIPSFTNDGCGMSNYAGDVSVALSDGDITAAVGDSSINITGSEITLTAGGQTITLNSSGVTVTDNLSVTGDMTNNSTNVGSDHVHTGVESGPNTTGGPQ